MLAHLKSSFICICQKRTTCLPASVPHWPRTSFPSNCRQSSTSPSSPTSSNTYEGQIKYQVSVVLFSVKLSRLNCSWSPAEPQIIVSSHGTIKQAWMEGILIGKDTMTALEVQLNWRCSTLICQSVNSFVQHAGCSGVWRLLEVRAEHCGKEKCNLKNRRTFSKDINVYFPISG